MGDFCYSFSTGDNNSQSWEMEERRRKRKKIVSFVPLFVQNPKQATAKVKYNCYWMQLMNAGSSYKPA
ncbi:hypothetical protein C5167_041400 [Papaver somniferum]|nr:hypothetical protein C5167_041400 [Papaver somniferum]